MVAADVPVALFLFNRPKHTARVLKAIRAQQPSHLLLVADGPRPGHRDDANLCAESRRIVEQIDWPCRVSRNFSNINLGCRKRISSGLTWVFEEVPEAIICEDDTLPHPSFFPFCAELLHRYRDEPRVMSIGGSLLVDKVPQAAPSYWFSRYPQIWGWATWRRAWTHYDLAMGEWPALRDSGWPSNLLERSWMAQHLSRVFDAAYDGFDTWDYAWTFASLRHAGLTALPPVNLVTNIGFDETATHGGSGRSLFANRPSKSLQFPLAHPGTLEPWVDGDIAFEAALKSEARRFVFDQLRQAIANRSQVARPSQ